MVYFFKEAAPNEIKMQPGFPQTSQMENTATLPHFRSLHVLATTLATVFKSIYKDFSANCLSKTLKQKGGHGKQIHY